VQPTAAASSNPPPAVIPLDQKTFEIQTLVGAGDINLERIQLVSAANSAIDLAGWKITDEQNNEFIFPSITIYPGGGLNIYTHSGINTAVEVFWGRESAVWSSGETAKLIDPEGNLRASYSIP
jgi:competence protein ComEC